MQGFWGCTQNCMVYREHNSPYMHKIIDSGRKRAVKDTATKKTLRFIKWLKKGKMFCMQLIKIME